jgi:hypothetical protein
MAAKVEIIYEVTATSLREVVTEANKANSELEAGAQKTSEKLSNTYKAVGKSFTSNFGGTQVRKTLDEQAKAFEQINKKATPLTRVLRGLKNELNQLEEEGKAGTAQFRQLTLEAARLEDQIGDTRARVANLASDTFKFDAAVQATQGLAAGFEIAQGAAALFGSESEDLNKVIAKTTAVMAIANGVQQVAALLLDESKLKTLVLTQATAAYNAIVGTSTGALKAFRIALAATGVGLLVVAIGALIANFDKLKDAIFGTSNTSRALKATLEDVRSGLSGAIEETTKVGTAFELARAGVISKEEALLTYNETLGDTFGRTENLNEAEALYNAKTKAYLEATALRTRAQALFAESAALSAKAATITGEEATNTIESIQTFIGASIASFNQLIGGAATATAASFRASNAVTENNAKEREKKLLEAQAKEIQDLGVTELTKAEVIENGAKIASEAEQKINAKRAERTKAANDKAAEAAKKAAEEQAAAREKLRQLENEAFISQLAEQDKILNESNNRILELEKAFRDAKFKAGSAEEIQAQKDLATAIEQVKTQANKQISDLEKQELEKSVQRQIEAAKVGASATLQEQLTSIQKQQQIELDNAEKLGKDKVEINKRYGEQIDAINKQIAQAEVNTQINTLERLEIEQGSSLDRRIELIEIEAAKRKKEATDNIKDEKERASAIQLIEAQTQEAIREERKRTTQETIDDALEIAQAIGNAFGSLADALKKQGDARIEFVQQAAADELEAINNSAKTEREKQRQREALELRTSRKVAEEKTKQARLDKQLALFNAIINTAAAIMKAGGPFTPIGALTAIAGAAQIATIAAQPIPKFAKGGLIGGRLHSAGGTLIEAERDEYIINRRQSVKHRRELDAINTSSAAFKKLIEERYVRPALLAYAGGRKNDAVIVNASLNSKSMEREIKGLRKDMRKQSTTVNINAYDTRYKWQ